MRRALLSIFSRFEISATQNLPQQHLNITTTFVVLRLCDRKFFSVTTDPLAAAKCASKLRVY
jgi:hypothetical protein